MKNFIEKTRILFFFCLFSLTVIAQDKTPQSQIKWLDYPDSFAQLLQQFKGKVVYIDVMASWCKPCLIELGEYKKMDDFFDQNNIVKLFISIDNPNDWKKCLKLLNDHQLSGYFTTYHRPEGIENKTFSAEVEKLFVSYDKDGKVTGLSIPQYIIVNKEGVFVEYKAERPSSFVKLKNQLNQYLQSVD